MASHQNLEQPTETHWTLLDLKNNYSMKKEKSETEMNSVELDWTH